VAACGTGNNGGDGLVIARHLHNAGAAVRVIVCGEEAKLSTDAAVNFGIVKAMGLPFLVSADPAALVRSVRSVTANDVLIDALLGTGFRGEVRAPLADVIHAINAAPRRAVVAADVPSGLDCDTGAPSAATVRADVTITFAAAKVGFERGDAARYVGKLVVVGIGTPPELVDHVMQETR
jgi:NAD(P)H-hydrate epimerase